jgi:hypothetical protein
LLYFDEKKEKNLSVANYKKEKELVSLKNSYHVVTLDYDQQTTIDLSLRFFAVHANK